MFNFVATSRMQWHQNTHVEVGSPLAKAIFQVAHLSDHIGIGLLLNDTTPLHPRPLINPTLHPNLSLLYILVENFIWRRAE